MLFALGYGLQDVLTPKDATAPVVRVEGIIYRPDLILSKRLNEIKTTRRSAKHHFIDEDIPVTWLDYMKGGCYMTDSNEYDLIVLYMMGNYAPPFPQLYADTFTFDEKEIVENWSRIVERKEVLDSALKTGKPPQPFKHCYEWECKYCRYQLVCNNMEDLQLWN